MQKKKIESKSKSVVIDVMKAGCSTTEPPVSERKAMPATTTRLINRIWGGYCSHYLVDDEMKEKNTHTAKKNEGLEDNIGDFEDIVKEKYEGEKRKSNSKQRKTHISNTEIKSKGGVVGRACSGKPLYKQAIVRGFMTLGGSVLIETEDSTDCRPIYFIEYMFEESNGSKWIHGRLMLRACQTVLESTGNAREVFLTTNCKDLEIKDITKLMVVEIRVICWGHQYRKSDANSYRIDSKRAEDRKNKGLPIEYFCKSLYSPERGVFLCSATESIGLGTGLCHSCKIKDCDKEDKLFKLDTSATSFRYQGTSYHVNEHLYIAPSYFKVDRRKVKLFKCGKNIWLKAYVVCQFLEIKAPKTSIKDNPKYVNIKVRRFFRPEDISAKKAYSSDIREVYYSDQTVMVPIVAIQGKCEIRRRQDFLFSDGAYVFEHIFFCEHMYDPESGAAKQLPVRIKLTASQDKVLSYAKRKPKSIKGEAPSRCIVKQLDAAPKKCLDTPDIFAGCGGLSEGLQQSGASITKCAIEYEESAGKAFKLNHPTAVTIINNCNVIPRAIMNACGDEEDCISSSEAAELASKELKRLPRPGHVDFINGGGPPCQGFSWLNRFNQSACSKVQCGMILALLSFVNYYRPNFFLLENVRNFVTFNKGQTFRLSLASLLEMGYQVKFGILEAGAYGVSQSRKLTFIWAASPEEILPEWPEPMHVFSGPQLKIPLTEVTVRDTIGDLPAVGNGASKTTMKESIRGDSLVLTDHMSKQMELNYIRSQRILNRPGADWCDLPD